MQDLREMFKKDREEGKYAMKQGHEERFAELLSKEFTIHKSSSYLWVKIAATIILFVGVVTFWVNKNTKNPVSSTLVDTVKTDMKNMSLGDLSPDLKQVENYYETSIYMELSQLEISKENKDIVGSFMNSLAELNAEYQLLNKELNELGPNDNTISALIKNLQLRLQLLQKLKSKLNELKASKNEQISTNIS